MLPKEVRTLAGRELGSRKLLVERGAIERYAEAVGDPNPLYRDDEYARSSRWGSVIAPPGFFGLPPAVSKGEDATPRGTQEMWNALARAGYPRVVNGGMEMEFLSPVRPGDTLTGSSRILDIVEREGRSGRMAFATVETAYTNQRGELVAVQRHTTVHR